MRSCFVPLVLLVAGIALLSSCTTVPAPTPATPKPSTVGTVWKLDRTDKIGGHSVNLLGNPRLVSDASGSALMFDGEHDGLILPVGAIAGLSQFTIEILMRPAAGGAEEQRFFHTQDSVGNRSLLEIRLLPEGRWTLDTFLLSGKNSLPLLDRTLLHPADQWHWVALRYDGRRMTSFVNGTQELTGEVEFPPMQSAGQTSIGVRLNQVYWFKGAIREIRLHPTALAVDKLAR